MTNQHEGLHRLRRVRLAALLLFACTGALGAQGRPPERTPGGSPGPVRSAVGRTLMLDAARAGRSEWRLAVEPIAIGRFTIGFAGSVGTEPEVPLPSPVLETLAPRDLVPCLPDASCPPIVVTPTRYRARSLAVHGRWYPAALSTLGRDGGAALYVGEFLAFEERRVIEAALIAVPDAAPVSGLGAPGPGTALTIPGRPTVTRASGWEPGLEAGVRLRVRRLLLDVGASTRFVRVDDPASRSRPGSTRTALVTAFGLAW